MIKSSGILRGVFCLDMPCPLSLAEMAFPKRTSGDCNSEQKKIGQLSLHFYSRSSFFPFYSPRPTSQLSIILTDFLVHRPTGFHLLSPLVRQCCLQSTKVVRHVAHADDRDADDDVGGVE